MPDTKDIPIIFLAYANRGRAESLEALEEENREIAKILFPMEEKRACTLLEENPDDNVFLWDLAHQPSYRERIQVVHIAGGRPGRKYIRMLSADGEVALEADEFADFFAQLPNLNLIFITGCANPRLVRRLLIKTRAAVIRIEHDERNEGVAKEFYAQLAKGFVLKRAFGQTTINCGDHLMYEVLTLGELTAPPFQRRDIFEGLYVRNDHRVSLEWKLSPSFYILLDSQTQGHGDVAERAIREDDGARIRPWLKPTLAGITSLIGVGLLLLSFFFGLPNQWMGQLTGNTVCPFPEESDAYNMLILPFYKAENCRRTGNAFRSSIKTSLEQFREEGGIPLNAQYHDAECPTSNFFARGLGGTCNADLVFWATQTGEGANDPSFTIEYVSNDRYEEEDLILEQGNPTALTNISQEAFQAEVAKRMREVIFWSQGIRRFRSENYEEAIEFFKLIPAQSARNSMACERQIARSYVKQGEFMVALDHYNNALEMNPNNISLWIERGKTFLELGDYEAAREDLDKAKTLNPSDSEVYLAMGFLFQKQNLPDSALNAFNQAVSADPDNIDAYLLRADQHRAMDNIDEAFTDYSRCIQKAPNRSEAYRGIGNLYEDLRDFPKAQEYYARAVLVNPRDHASLFYQGSLHTRYGRLDKAVIDLSEAINLSPREGKYYSFRALAYNERGEDTLALADAERGVELAPNEPLAFAFRGQVYANGRDFGPAADDFDYALELDPTCEEAHFGRGILNNILGNYETAISNLREALTINPSMAYAYCKIGEIYNSFLLDPDKAMESFNQAIEADPTLSIAYELRADLHVDMDNLEQALADNTQAIAQNNGRPGPYSNRAGIYTALKRYEEAKKDVQRAIELSQGEKPMHYYLLAEIYAGQRNDSLFFHNLELALKHGIPIEEFEVSEFDLFRKDERFQSLLVEFASY